MKEIARIAKLYAEKSEMASKRLETFNPTDFDPATCPSKHLVRKARRAQEVFRYYEAAMRNTAALLAA